MNYCSAAKPEKGIERHSQAVDKCHCDKLGDAAAIQIGNDFIKRGDEMCKMIPTFINRFHVTGLQLFSPQA